MAFIVETAGNCRDIFCDFHETVLPPAEFINAQFYVAIIFQNALSISTASRLENRKKSNRKEEEISVGKKFFQLITKERQNITKFMHRIIVEAGPKKTKVRRGAEHKSEIFRREKRTEIQGAHYNVDVNEM